MGHHTIAVAGVHRARVAVVALRARPRSTNITLLRAFEVVEERLRRGRAGHALPLAALVSPWACALLQLLVRGAPGLRTGVNPDVIAPTLFGLAVVQGAGETVIAVWPHRGALARLGQAPGSLRVAHPESIHALGLACEASLA